MRGRYAPILAAVAAIDVDDLRVAGWTMGAAHGISTAKRPLVWQFGARGPSAAKESMTPSFPDSPAATGNDALARRDFPKASAAMVGATLGTDEWQISSPCAATHAIATCATDAPIRSATARRFSVEGACRRARLPSHPPALPVREPRPESCARRTPARTPGGSARRIGRSAVVRGRGALASAIPQEALAGERYPASQLARMDSEKRRAHLRRVRVATRPADRSPGMIGM